MALPSAPFDAAKSIFAGKSIIQLTIGETSLVFESTKLTHKDNRKFFEVKRPDAKGALRPVRRVCVEGAEEFMYVVDEAKRLVTDIFGGSLSGLATGTATIWEPDPADASGHVALKSETDFECDIMRDGDSTFGDSKVTEVTIKISSKKLGDVTWTPDAVVS